MHKFLSPGFLTPRGQRQPSVASVSERERSALAAESVGVGGQSRDIFVGAILETEGVANKVGRERVAGAAVGAAYPCHGPGREGGQEDGGNRADFGTEDALHSRMVEKLHSNLIHDTPRNLGGCMGLCVGRGRRNGAGPYRSPPSEGGGCSAG